MVAAVGSTRIAVTGVTWCAMTDACVTVAMRGCDECDDRVDAGVWTLSSSDANERGRGDEPRRVMRGHGQRRRQRRERRRRRRCRRYLHLRVHRLHGPQRGEREAPRSARRYRGALRRPLLTLSEAVAARARAVQDEVCALHVVLVLLAVHVVVHSLALVDGGEDEVEQRGVELVLGEGQIMRGVAIRDVREALE